MNCTELILSIFTLKILEWPECSVQGNRDEDQQLKESITSGFRNPVVNSVEMSSDGHFLAAVTDNNLVCIWRYAPPVTAANTSVIPVTAASSGSTAVPAAEVTSTAAAPVAELTATAVAPPAGADDAGNSVDSILMNISVGVDPDTANPESLIQSDPSAAELPAEDHEGEKESLSSSMQPSS